MANEVKYIDQVWPDGTPIEGEQLSVNGTYTGQHKGMPMQDGKYDTGNNDPYYVEHVTVRFGTIMQDGAEDANMPVKGTNTVTNTLTGCTSSDKALVCAAGTDYVATYTADAGYALPSTITVTNGGSALTVTNDYTWTSGVLTVKGDKITGNLVITVTATVSG